MAVSIVIVDAKAYPFAATLPPTVDGPGDLVDLDRVGVRKVTAPTT
jgi:hypothetical protein